MSAVADSWIQKRLSTINVVHGTLFTKIVKTFFSISKRVKWDMEKKMVSLASSGLVLLWRCSDACPRKSPLAPSTSPSKPPPQAGHKPQHPPNLDPPEFKSNIKAPSLHYRLRCSIGFLNVPKSPKAAGCFSFKEPPKLIMNMAQILCKTIFSLCWQNYENGLKVTNV